MLGFFSLTELLMDTQAVTDKKKTINHLSCMTHTSAYIMSSGLFAWSIKEQLPQAKKAQKS